MNELHSTGLSTSPVFQHLFNLDSTFTESTSIIATSLSAETRRVPLLYKETIEQVCSCVCAHVCVRVCVCIHERKKG